MNYYVSKEGQQGVFTRYAVFVEEHGRSPIAGLLAADKELRLYEHGRAPAKVELPAGRYTIKRGATTTLVVITESEKTGKVG